MEVKVWRRKSSEQIADEFARRDEVSGELQERLDFLRRFREVHGMVSVYEEDPKSTRVSSYALPVIRIISVGSRRVERPTRSWDERPLCLEALYSTGEPFIFSFSPVPLALLLS